jgi:V/A-type H+-transporting ATPase subunit E
MSEELQSLIEKINREGVEKAEAEAAKIKSAAETEAAEIVKRAQAEADKLRSQAEADARAYAERAAETIRQTARDTVISVENAVLKKLEAILVRNVDAALADGQMAAGLACGAVRDLASGACVAANSKFAAAIGAQLAAEAIDGVDIVTDDTLGTGFRVKLDGGRVEHDYTGATVAEALAKRLRPDLARLMR